MALGLFAACASGDTASETTAFNTVELSTQVATTAPVPDAAAPGDPIPIPLSIPTAIVVPTATAAALTSVPTVAVTATSEAVTPAAPSAAATVGPAADGSAPTAAPTVPAPVAGSQTVLAANGGEVYTLNCARCHAENGLGADASQYSSPLIGVGNTYSTAGMITELTSGHPVTFGFADRLSADEIASVVAFVKATFP